MPVTTFFVRVGPGARELGPELEGLDVRVLRTRPGLLAPLWGFLTNLAHGAGEKGAHPMEGALDLDSLFYLSLRVSRLRPSILLCEDQFSGLVGYIAHRLTGVDYVVYLHEGLYEDTFREMPHLTRSGRSRVQALARNLNRRVLSHAAGLAANSDATLRSVERSGYHIPGTVVFPASTSVPTTERGTLREPLVLAVSTWDTARHPELYLETARRLESGKLVLAGMWRYDYGDERERFDRLVREQRLEGKVVVTGRIPQTDLDALYARAKVFLRFGVDEYGPGMGCLEAMANSIPVIANRPLGATELIEDGVSGFVLDSPDPVRASELANRILADPSLWQSMSLAAGRSARGVTWEAHGRLLRDVLAAATVARCRICTPMGNRTPGPRHSTGGSG